MLVTCVRKVFPLISPRELRERARNVTLLLMDVDGVLTDGRIYYVPGSGGRLIETKTFHSRDGLGIRFAHEAGLKTGIISGRRSPAVQHRIRELGIHYVRQNVLEKLPPYESILKSGRFSDADVCYMGDDLVDLPILKRAGLAVGVANGHPFLRRHVHYCTQNRGGAGAVRETIELILAAKGKLQPLFKYYLR
jgi:3-deoxy-D-manno-octulosonate 8-phosphate phosphatase (KDO 8-P phosphatase)